MKYKIGNSVYDKKDQFFVLLSYRYLWNDELHDGELRFNIDKEDIEGFIEIMEYDSGNNLDYPKRMDEILCKYDEFNEVYKDGIDGYEIRYIGEDGVEYYVEIVYD